MTFCFIFQFLNSISMSRAQFPGVLGINVITQGFARGSTVASLRQSQLGRLRSRRPGTLSAGCFCSGLPAGARASFSFLV